MMTGKLYFGKDPEGASRVEWSADAAKAVLEEHRGCSCKDMGKLVFLALFGGLNVPPGPKPEPEVVRIMVGRERML